MGLGRNVNARELRKPRRAGVLSQCNVPPSSVFSKLIYAPDSRRGHCARLACVVVHSNKLTTGGPAARIVAPLNNPRGEKGEKWRCASARCGKKSQSAWAKVALWVRCQIVSVLWWIFSLEQLVNLWYRVKFRLPIDNLRWHLFRDDSTLSLRCIWVYLFWRCDLALMWLWE